MLSTTRQYSGISLRGREGEAHVCYMYNKLTYCRNPAPYIGWELLHVTLTIRLTTGIRIYILGKT